MEKRGFSGPGKAQASIEFLLVVGFAMVMTLPLVVIFFQQSESLNTEITASQIDKVASEIRDSADEVYYLGAPSKKTVTLFFPENIQDARIEQNRIIFTVDSPDSDYEIVKWTIANLTGNLRNFSGIHKLSVEATADSEVLIVDP